MGNIISSLIGEGVVVAWHDFRSGCYADLSGYGNDRKLTTFNAITSMNQRNGIILPGPGGDVVGSYAYTTAGSQYGPTSGTLVWAGYMKYTGLNIWQTPIKIGPDDSVQQGWPNHAQLYTSGVLGVPHFRVRANNVTRADFDGATNVIERVCSIIATWDSSAATMYVDGAYDSQSAGDKTTNFATPANFVLRYGSASDDKYCQAGYTMTGMLVNRALDATEAAALHAELMS